MQQYIVKNAFADADMRDKNENHFLNSSTIKSKLNQISVFINIFSYNMNRKLGINDFNIKICR